MKKIRMEIKSLDTGHGGALDSLLRLPLRYPFVSFGYLTGGEASLEIDGQDIRLSPGQLILLPEDKSVVIRHYKDATGFVGYFWTDFLKDASYSVLHTPRCIIQSFWFDDAVFIGQLFKRMITAYEDRDTAFLQSGLDLILGQLRPGSASAAVPEKFLQLVFDRSTTPLGVSEYAQMLHVTPNYLNKTVKAHTRRTAIDWIEIARLNLAKQLLRDHSIPIEQVAAKAGLPDQSYFARFFKKKMGVTPTQFRASEE